MRQALPHRIYLGPSLLVGALGGSLCPRQQVVEVLHVGQDQLQLDRLHVGHRIDFSRHVDHVGIVEAADHLEDGVDLADVGEKLVAESLPLAGPLHDPGDVDELERGRDHLLCWDQGRDPPKAVVGHAHHPLVGLDRAERVVRALGRLRHRERVEERALADVREADDTCFHEAAPGGVIRRRHDTG